MSNTKWIWGQDYMFSSPNKSGSMRTCTLLALEIYTCCLMFEGL